MQKSQSDLSQVDAYAGSITFCRQQRPKCLHPRDLNQIYSTLCVLSVMAMVRWLLCKLFKQLLGAHERNAACGCSSGKFHPVGPLLLATILMLHLRWLLVLMVLVFRLLLLVSRLLILWLWLSTRLVSLALSTSSGHRPCTWVLCVCLCQTLLVVAVEVDMVMPHLHLFCGQGASTIRGTRIRSHPELGVL